MGLVPGYLTFAGGRVNHYTTRAVNALNILYTYREYFLPSNREIIFNKQRVLIGRDKDFHATLTEKFNFIATNLFIMS